MNLFKLSLAAAAVITIASCNNTNKVSTTSIKTEADSMSYALGVVYGDNFKNGKLEELNVKAFAMAIESIYRGDSSKILFTRESATNYLNSYFMKKEQKVAAKNLEESKKFLEENAKKEGVIVDSTGLQYKVITEGTGPMPQAEDMVKVNYRGTLIDGTEFDSSYGKGQPAQFQLNRVIRGWTIGLQKMKVGSKYMLYIPSDLAYGERTRQGGPIGPNQALIFEVELLEIVKQEPAKK
jgi:FKBP-type peptidyl-prolyl cis-trans isomerase